LKEKKPESDVPEENSGTKERAVTEEEGMKVNSGKTVDSTPKHQGRPAAIVPAAAALSNQMDPCLEAMVKRTLDLDDDEDDDIVNNNTTKKAKRAHDDDGNVDPLKAATQDIEDVLVDTDAEENKQNKENSFQDLSQHSSQALSQEQNPNNEDGNDDEAINQRVLLLFFQAPQAPFMFFKAAQ